MATAFNAETGTAVERMTALVESDDRFDISAAELLPTQIEAANELFTDRVGKIKLLQNRAEEGNISAITSAADIVPLLFAHTAYKSYPEPWLIEQKWDRLGKWLSTVSVNKVEGVDLDGVGDIDDWLGRLENVGHFVSCSSGTTGKCAMMDSSAEDLAWSHRETIASVSWGAGIEAARDRVMIGTGAVAHSPRNLVTRDALVAGFGRTDRDPYFPPVPPITIGQITGMVALRKAMAEGTAKASEIAGFEQTSAARQAMMTAAHEATADAIIAARGEKLFLSGMWAMLHPIAEMVRAKGYSAKDFHPDNACYIGGGLKGAVLPPDFKEYIFETFNLSPERTYQMYGMQEINSSMPRCKAGRYHVPPWVMLLLLDQEGENLIEPTPGVEQEGRAAFFDISVNGRWNGVISGDKIMADYGRCECGSQSPSIADNITRYSDLPGGDKISCSGTIDAYVRGVS